MRSSLRIRAVQNLATAFLLAPWNELDLRKAARLATGLPYRRTPAFIRKLVAAFPAPPAFELLTEILNRMWRESPPIRQIFVLPERMGLPPASAGPVVLPQLATEADLAQWLGLTPSRLRWCADVTGRNQRHPEGPLRTYRYRWLPKPNGRSRLLEIPQTHLKLIQRKILDAILIAIPPHEAAHGFRPGRSILTNSEPHCGKQIVLRFDLRDFFPSVSCTRVFRIFRTFGYPVRVSRLLTGLCTTRLPRDVWDGRPHPAVDGSDHATWQHLASRHLPQGAPTSPALANLAAYRLDCRLAKLASSVGAEYTRYADDLAISGGEELARMRRRITVLVAVIALEEGFAMQHRKTRIMSRGGRQTIAGVVVNVRPNLPRAVFDLLKAILTNCVRHGPASQNRENRSDFRAYLSGRVSHFASVNPNRGRKLWLIFDRIEWTSV
jgi:RNA-directed DNA polymerase